MLFGSGIFVMFVSIAPIVAILSSKKSSVKTVMDKKAIDDVNGRIANFTSESISSTETIDDVTKEITNFLSTVCNSETENEGT